MAAQWQSDQFAWSAINTVQRHALTRRRGQALGFSQFASFLAGGLNLLGSARPPRSEQNRTGRELLSSSRPGVRPTAPTEVLLIDRVDRNPVEN